MSTNITITEAVLFHTVRTYGKITWETMKHLPIPYNPIMQVTVSLLEYKLLIDVLKSMVVNRLVIMSTQNVALQIRFPCKCLITVSALHDGQSYNKMFSRGTFLNGLLSPRSNPSPLISAPSVSKRPSPP